MENASKALIIAGSILIAILLIAFAVKTISSTTGTQDNLEDAMKTTEVSTFNNKFLAYMGINKSKADAQSLLNVIIASNSTSNRKIEVAFLIKKVDGVIDGIAGYKNTIQELQKCINSISKADSSSKFTIKIPTKNGAGKGDGVDGYDSNGYITKIYITNVN